MFPTSTRDHLNHGTIAIEEQRAIAEAQGKIIIAKRFPRDRMGAYQQIIETCQRHSFAEKAMYSYPRGGEVIKGPSIRLAEELARAWGNIDFGIRELSEKNGITEVEAYCWDMETNTSSSMKFTVKHERHTKSGVKKLTDPRDIYETMANQAGRRLRSRILSVIPPDLQEAAVAECAKTLSGGNGVPLIDRVKKMLGEFSKLGISKGHIEQRIGKKVESILPDEFTDLIGIYNSIKDGLRKPSDWFAGIAPEPTTPTSGVLGQISEKITGSPNIPLDAQSINKDIPA